MFPEGSTKANSISNNKLEKNFEGFKSKLSELNIIELKGMQNQELKIQIIFAFTVFAYNDENLRGKFEGIVYTQIDPFAPDAHSIDWKTAYL